MPIKCILGDEKKECLAHQTKLTPNDSLVSEVAAMMVVLMIKMKILWESVRHMHIFFGFSVSIQWRVLKLFNISSRIS